LASPRVSFPASAPRAVLAIVAAAFAAVTGAPGCRSMPVPNLGGGEGAAGRGARVLSLPAPPPGGYDLDKPYPLLSGDLINIIVLDDATLSNSYEIGSDGYIELFRSEKEPGMPRERVLARGLTPLETADRIAAAYAVNRFQTKPFVQVRVETAVPRVVFVTGSVRSPQPVPLPVVGRLTLYRALQIAGGRTEEADWSKVTVSRRDPATGAEVALPPFNLEEMEAAQAFDRDPVLEPGDILHVPRLGHVTIFGKVNAPGRYLCRPGLKLTDLIGEASGLQAFAKRGDIRVIRAEGTAKESVYTVDLNAIFDGKASDPPLRAGDRIEVAEDWK
jgi:protein involved in polysaccharide export with SLBB domain